MRRKDTRRDDLALKEKNNAYFWFKEEDDYIVNKLSEIEKRLNNEEFLKLQKYFYELLKILKDYPDGLTLDQIHYYLLLRHYYLRKAFNYLKEFGFINYTGRGIKTDPKVWFLVDL